MKEIIWKGFIIIGIYAFFLSYLFFACERFENLEEEDDLEIVNVNIKYSE